MKKSYNRIYKKIEKGSKHFLYNIKIQASQTKEASQLIQKYIKEGKLNEQEEEIIKMQVYNSLKIIGVVIPFVLIPGATILMPILIKVANKNNIKLLPTEFKKHE